MNLFWRLSHKSFPVHEWPDFLEQHSPWPLWTAQAPGRRLNNTVLLTWRSPSLGDLLKAHAPVWLGQLMKISQEKDFPGRQLKTFQVRKHLSIPPSWVTFPDFCMMGSSSCLLLFTCSLVFHTCLYFFKLVGAFMLSRTSPVICFPLLPFSFRVQYYFWSSSFPLCSPCFHSTYYCFSPLSLFISQVNIFHQWLSCNCSPTTGKARTRNIRLSRFY